MMVWQWLQNIPLQDPVERRLSPLLQLVIIAIAFALLVAFILAMIQVGLAGLPADGVALAVFVWVVLGSGLLILRRGYFRLTTWLLLILLFILSVRRIVISDIPDADESLIVYFLPIVIAGLFLGRIPLLGVFVLTALVILHPDQLQKIESDTASTFLLTAALVAFFIDLLASTLRTELSAALVRNQELQEIHRALKASSAELFKANEQLNITLRSIGDAVITTDTDARVLMINEVAQRLTGWTQEEAQGQPLATVFHIINEYTREVVESPADKVLREGKIVGLANHTLLITKDGREIPIDDSGAPIKSNDGTISGVVLVFRDITERKETEEREREMIAVQERHRLARELHDSVTQSMFSANTRAEIIPRLWARDPDAAMEHLQQMITINRGAMAEMRTLLLELRPEAVLNSTLAELYQQLVVAAPTRRAIDAKVTVEGEGISLPSEVHIALYRIVQEAVNNILKHSQAGHFQIDLIYLENEVQVAVVDDGQGFDVNAPTSGFGLTSMQERAEGIHADFEITSALGEGTTVRVRWTNSHVS